MYLCYINYYLMLGFLAAAIVYAYSQREMRKELEKIFDNHFKKCHNEYQEPPTKKSKETIRLRKR